MTVLDSLLSDFNMWALMLAAYGLCCVVVGMLMIVGFEWARCLWYLPEDAYPTEHDRLKITNRMLDEYEMVLRRYSQAGYEVLIDRADGVADTIHQLQIDVAVEIEKAQTEYHNRWQYDSNGTRIDW